MIISTVDSRARFAALALCVSLAACNGGDDEPTVASQGDVALTDDDPSPIGDAGSDTIGGPPDTDGSVRDDVSINTGPNFSFSFDDGFADRQAGGSGAPASLAAFYEQALAPLNALEGLLPHSVPVIYGRCGFANAFFAVDAGTITLCDELTQVVFELYAAPDAEGVALEDEVAAQATLSTMAFVLYHEVGHALDEELDLPLLGNIESGADSIAAVISVETGNSIYAVLGGLLFAEQPASFGDSHGGGEDRAGDLICWALGGDSRLVFNAAFQPFVNEFAVVGRDCTAEYAAQRSVVLDALPGLGGLPEAVVPPPAALAIR